MLDADVLGNSCDLADVRIVTAEDRQVPYLVEKRNEPVVVPLQLTRVEAPRGTSVYRVVGPTRRCRAKRARPLTRLRGCSSEPSSCGSAGDRQRGRSPQHHRLLDMASNES